MILHILFYLSIIVQCFITMALLFRTSRYIPKKSRLCLFLISINFNSFVHHDLQRRIEDILDCSFSLFFQCWLTGPSVTFILSYVLHKMKENILDFYQNIHSYIEHWVLSSAIIWLYYYIIDSTIILFDLHTDLFIRSKMHR
jgi:hypothetical protein